MKLSNFCGEPSRLQKIAQLSEERDAGVCPPVSSPSQQRYPQNCHNPGSGMFQFEMWQVPGCCIACSSCARAVNGTKFHNARRGLLLLRPSHFAESLNLLRHLHRCLNMVSRCKTFYKENAKVKFHEVPLTAQSVLCITAINPITTQLKQRNPVPAVQINRTPTVAS